MGIQSVGIQPEGIWSHGARTGHDHFRALVVSRQASKGRTRWIAYVLSQSVTLRRVVAADRLALEKQAGQAGRRGGRPGGSSGDGPSLYSPLQFRAP